VDENRTDAVMVHPTATVEEPASIGPGTRVWHYAHVRAGARVGAECVLGKGVYVDTDVVVGDRVKAQNNASLYKGARVESGVFIGPHVVLTNDRLPRAITPEGRLKTEEDWQIEGVVLRHGASIGAASVVLPGVEVGEWALVGAGSLVTTSIPAHAVAFGTPARVHGYVCSCGNSRAESRDQLRCGCLPP
jgi:acetyltransferase-like isoleucine patch superfamily enzyme